MSSLAIILFVIGATILYIAIKLNKLLKNNSNSAFMQNESQRILLNNAEVDSNYTSSGRIYTRGLSLIKNEDSGKYNLISQAKVCDIGLY